MTFAVLAGMAIQTRDHFRDKFHVLVLQSRVRQTQEIILLASSSRSEGGEKGISSMVKLTSMDSMLIVFSACLNVNLTALPFLLSFYIDLFDKVIQIHEIYYNFTSHITCDI